MHVFEVNPARPFQKDLIDSEVLRLFLCQDMFQRNAGGDVPARACEPVNSSVLY